MRYAIIFSCIIFWFYSCKKDSALPVEDALPATMNRMTVIDTLGVKQAGCNVKLFYSVNELLKDSNAYLQLQTNTDGVANLPEHVNDTIIAVATRSDFTSEFVFLKYGANVTSFGKEYVMIIKKSSSKQLLCGHGSKKWLMTSYKLNGNTQAYVVTSIINEDGTWTDTNGNSGTWQFVNNNAQLFYTYSGSGMSITFDVTELRKDFIKLNGVMGNMAVEMEMTKVYY